MRKKSEQGDTDGETLLDHWLVPTMHTFENVGFTHNVGTIKYLTCADCEVGPIGMHDTQDKSAFYVSLARIRHGEEPTSRPRWS